MSRERLRQWIEKQLVIEVPEGAERESFLKGFVAGVQDERKRVREKLRKVT